MKRIKLDWRLLKNLKRHITHLDGKAIEILFTLNQKKDRHFTLLRHRRMIVIGLYYFALLVQIKPKNKKVIQYNKELAA